jgi:predicted esterase
MMALAAPVWAQDSVERTTTIATLFPAEELPGLAKTLPIDRVLHFRVRIPPGAAPNGLLIFVKPSNSGELPPGWAPVLDERNLVWIAADDFGNERPSAQRALVAIAASKLIQSSMTIESRRIYVAGMSGGGRIASHVVTHFPRQFAGALFIVGADFWTKYEEPLRQQIAANRYVFVTGGRDFNHREMRNVYARYRAAGASQSLLIDQPRFGHEYPDATQLARAIDFLDAR